MRSLETRTTVKLLIAFIFFFSGSITVIAQQSTGSVSGKVNTSDGAPADGVSVQLKGKALGTTSNAKGEFIIKKIKPGSYTLIATFTGHQPEEQDVIIEAGKETNVSFKLTLSAEELNNVVVTRGRNKFVKKESEFVSKMPLRNLENPQVYNSISKELLEEQVTTDFTNAVKNTPGVYKLSGMRGINTSGTTAYSIRGFRSEVSMIDGIPTSTNGDLDPVLVERIEVMKGPSATMYGGATTYFGGLINVVTKKPQEVFGGEVAYYAGSYSLNRITADVYGPASKNVSFRLNAAYQNQGSFQDAGFRKSMFFAPAVELRLNEKLKINLNAEISQMEGTNQPAIFLNRTRPFIAKSPKELNFDFKRSYTSNDITIKTPATNVRAVISYKISDKWLSQTIISGNTRKTDGYYQYQFIRKPTDDSLERQVSYQNTINTALDVQQNFTGEFKIGNIRNRMVVGVDYLNLKANNDNSPYIVFDFVNGLLNNDPNYAKISKLAIDAKLQASTAAATHNHTQTHVYSAYVSDVVNITDNLLAMLSARVDHYKSDGTVNHATNAKLANSEYDQTSLSPKFGLVYQVVKNKVSVFANYMNGFSNLAPVTQPLPDISGVLKPQQANQYEGGVKIDVFKNRLALTASYYDILLKNVTLSQTIVRNGTSYNITVQDGSQRSKGFELELIANPLKGLNVVAGYGHNNSKYEEAAAALKDRRPAEAGPADLVNFWVSYAFAQKFNGLGVGFGGNYVSRFYTSNSAITGQFVFPAYTLLNASIFYDTKHYRLAVKAENMGNTAYFVGQGVVTPQMPRNYTASVAVKF